MEEKSNDSGHLESLDGLALLAAYPTKSLKIGEQKGDYAADISREEQREQTMDAVLDIIEAKELVK